ncbi:MAG: hypothetical protein L6R39_005238, partial [Caloplaca ligustica]
MATATLHYLQGSVRKMGVTTKSAFNPYRDIFYDPPDDHSGIPRGGFDESPLSANAFRYSHRRSSRPPFRRLSINPQAQTPVQSGIQQQRSNLTYSAAQHEPASSSTAPTPESLDIDEYHRLADTYIDNLVAKLEQIQEERDEVDCEYS